MYTSMISSYTFWSIGHFLMHCDAFHHQNSDPPPALPVRSLRKVWLLESKSSLVQNFGSICRGVKSALLLFIIYVVFVLWILSQPNSFIFLLPAGGHVALSALFLFLLSPVVFQTSVSPPLLPLKVTFTWLQVIWKKRRITTIDMYKLSPAGLNQK